MKQEALQLIKKHGKAEAARRLKVSYSAIKRWELQSGKHFICSICGKELSEYSKLKQHEMKIHGKSTTGPLLSLQVLFFTSTSPEESEESNDTAAALPGPALTLASPEAEEEDTDNKPSLGSDVGSDYAEYTGAEETQEAAMPALATDMSNAGYAEAREEVEETETVTEVQESVLPGGTIHTADIIIIGAVSDTEYR